MTMSFGDITDVTCWSGSMITLLDWVGKDLEKIAGSATMEAVSLGCRRQFGKQVLRPAAFLNSVSGPF